MQLHHLIDRIIHEERRLAVFSAAGRHHRTAELLHHQLHAVADAEHRGDVENGRIDIVENRLVGMKSRGCYETPGGTIIVAGLRALESLVYDRTSLKYREEVGLEVAQLVYDGRWFTPLKDALFAASNSLADQLTGDIVVKLYKGQVTVAKRRSPNSLYSEAFATFEGDEVYNQKDAAGFIRLYSLASRIRALHSKG